MRLREFFSDYDDSDFEYSGGYSKDKKKNYLKKMAAAAGVKFDGPVSQFIDAMGLSGDKSKKSVTNQVLAVKSWVKRSYTKGSRTTEHLIFNNQRATDDSVKKGHIICKCGNINFVAKSSLLKPVVYTIYDGTKKVSDIPANRAPRDIALDFLRKI